MIDRFTEKAREAIGLAIDAAESLGHTYVGTEHLLIGHSLSADHPRPGGPHGGEEHLHPQCQEGN